MRNRPASMWGRQGGVDVVVWAAALFAAITVWRFADANPVAGIGFLYVLPIVLLAARFGLLGGSAGAVCAMALTAWWGSTHSTIELYGGAYVVRAGAFLAVAAVVAWQVRRRYRSEREADRWFAMSHDLCCVANLQGYFTRVNEAWTRHLGYTGEELLDRPFVSFVHPDDVERTNVEASALAASPHVTVDFENRYRAKDGSWRWLLWTSRSDGQRIYAAARDITERKALEAKLHALAIQDPLTGLPNRRAWDARADEELHLARHSGAPLSVAMIDLDGLKGINDTNGHEAGDRHLTSCATAWARATRARDFLARVGGDEFALLLPEADVAAADEVVERLRAAAPGIAFSAGVAAVDPERGVRAAVRNADEALYEAKTAGRSTTVVRRRLVPPSEPFSGHLRAPERT